MTNTEVARLLAFAYSLDARVGLSDEKAIAWASVINQHMPYDMGLDFVRKHYAGSKDVIMPSDLNLMFRNSKQEPVAIEITHSEGWVKATSEQTAHWVAKIRKDMAAFGSMDTPYTPVAGD